MVVVIPLDGNVQVGDRNADVISPVTNEVASM